MDYAKLKQAATAAHPGMMVVEAGDVLNLLDLVERVVRNAGHRQPAGMRWGHVTRVFGVGSTRAVAMCRVHGLDPDEVVGVEEDEGDDMERAGAGGTE